jgi:GNAT superfamily N-acetyltransferase
VANDIARIAAFDRGSIEHVADALVEIPEGWVARTPSLRWVYYLNHVRVNVPIETSEAVSLLEQHMGDMPYRHLVIGDEPTGERVTAALRPAGWEIGRDVHMAFTGEVDLGLDTSAVTEIPEEDAVGLMTRWVSEDEDCRGKPEMIREIVEAVRLAWRARNARRYAVRNPDGTVAAMTMLFSDGSVAQVEDVYVTPEARGHRLGRTLVTHAVRQAVESRHDVVWLVANAEDWPKELYVKIGFEPVAHIWTAHRQMSA